LIKNEDRVIISKRCMERFKRNSKDSLGKKFGSILK